MILVQCKRQNGVVQEFLAYFNSRQPHALRSGRLPQRGRGPAGSPRPARRSPERKRRGGRAARAPPGPAGRGKGDWRRRGALPGTARAGPPPRARGPRSGAGARGCPAESSRWGATAVSRRAAGRKSAGRSAGQRGPEPRRLEGMLLLTSRRRLRIRPLRAEDACPRVRELRDKGEQLRGRRRAKERTDGGPRAAGGERERTRAGGGGRAGSDVRAPERPAGSSWRQSRPRARAHTPCSATIAQECIHALKARRLTNHGSRVEHHGNSGAIKDRVAILYSPNHSSSK